MTSRPRVLAPATIGLVVAAVLLALLGTASWTGAQARTARPSATAPTAPTPQAPPTRRQPAAGSAGVLTLDWGDIDATPQAWRGAHLVLQPWEGHRIAALKQRNPRLQVLMYKDVAAVRRDAHESGVYSTGLSYAEAERHGWLLTDRRGRPLQWADWSDLHPTDVGSPGYQDRWARNVLAELRRHPWDGVMMDDTLTYLSHPTVGDRTSVQIPTDDAMYAATGSFLERVGGAVRRAGYDVVPNLTVEWDTWEATLADWTRHVTGWENEYFVKWGLERDAPRFVGADWEWKMRMAEWLARRDVPLLAVTYSNRDDLALQTYHRASWLLTWNGRTGASVFVPAEDHVDHWTARATVDVGQPRGPRRQVDGGVWRRDYTEGMALVNPTATARTVDLGGTYRTLAGQRVGSVRLPPSSGAVVRRDRSGQG